MNVFIIKNTRPLTLKAVLCTAFFILSGCEGGGELATLFHDARKSVSARAETSCPAISVAPELRSISEFADPQADLPQRLVYRMDIDTVTAECTQAQNGADVITVNFNYTATLGGIGRVRPDDQPGFSVPYFVALLDPQMRIVHKEMLLTTASFPVGQNQVEISESVTFPVPPTLALKTDFKAVAGFQLADWQLNYNRAQGVAETQAVTTPEMQVVSEDGNAP